MAQTFSPWQRAGSQYPAGDAPFRAAETLGGQPFAHDRLDAVRMSWRRTPESEYPAGLLGTLNSRRGDRLMDGLKARQNNRPYTRGIHKGSRLDNKDYFWPDEFNLMSAVINEGQGKFDPDTQSYICPRYVSPGIGGFLPDERYVTDRKEVGPRSVAAGYRYSNGIDQGPNAPLDPDRVPALRAQAPPYGPRRNPGMRPVTTGRAQQSSPYPGR